MGIKDGDLFGIFPLFFQKGPVRMVFSPPPHTALFYLGPVMTGYGTLSQEKWEQRYFYFQNSVENFIIHELKADYVSISLAPGIQDSRPFGWSGYEIEPNFDYVVNLTKGIDVLFKSLDKQDRAGLRKAKEKGMTFEIGTKKECEQILNLMDIRYSQQGKVMTTSRGYFSDIYDAFEKNIKIVLVYFEDEIVTGSIDLQYGETLYGWVGNPKPKKLISPSPNNFLFWESIRYASENNLNFYTTLGAAGDKRLHKYYAARFNPELLIRYVATRKSLIAGISEKGYTNILKPLRGSVKHFISGE
jgi:hypothetical protein